MRTKKHLSLLPFLCLLAAGCGAAGPTAELSGIAGTDTFTSAYQEEQDMTVNMTEEQKALLKSISINESRVETGELLAWQIEVLNQYDTAMTFLREKYPSHTFYITDCAQKNASSSFTTFWFAEGTYSPKTAADLPVYELRIDAKEDKGSTSYLCRDNFYAALVAEPYEALLLDLIRENVPECFKIHTEIHSVQGAEFNESISAEQILNRELQVSNNTDIFLNGTSQQDTDTLAASVEALIHEKNIYGSYTLYVLDSPDRDTDAADLYHSPCLLKYSFQHFE